MASLGELVVYLDHKIPKVFRSQGVIHPNSIDIPKGLTLMLNSSRQLSVDIEGPLHPRLDALESVR